MFRSVRPLLLLLSLAIVVPACAQPEPAGDRAADLEVITKAIHDSIGWALTKDRPRLEEILAHDADFFIFSPDSGGTVVGWERFVQNFDFWMDPRFEATHFDVRELRVNFSQSGDVAWYSAILDDCFAWEGQPGCWKDTRWTGVLERREGKWSIVQMHFSFASDAGEAETDAQEEE